MNASDPIAHQQAAVKPSEPGRTATFTRFQLEEFQHLSKDDLSLAQSLAGHGYKWGVWSTPKSICPSGLKDYLRTIDFAKRIRYLLVKNRLAEESPERISDLVNEGALVLTRLSLLMRLAPTTGKGKSKNHRLKPSSITSKLYINWSAIVARAICRKAKQNETLGLLACLTQDDVRELCKDRRQRTEIERLDTLGGRGWWSDLPPQPDITQTTDPSGPRSQPVQQDVPGEYRHISDKYLEEFGPRNLWVIRELGPHLLALLENLATYFENLDWSKMTQNKFRGKSSGVQKFIARHLKEYPWIDQLGRPLKPNFPLITGKIASSKDAFEFPPRNWEQLKVLSATLQSSQLFLTLLASAGRDGEVYTLPRSCVVTQRDGKDYMRGTTYKLSDNLFGDTKHWPAPPILVQALGQQARLANVWVRLPSRAIENGLSTEPQTHTSLWLSLGSARTVNAAEPLSQHGHALQQLATRIGMDPRPDGINLHPHRLRKTIGRLAGVALFNSPNVLKRLFGHKCIEMTLHYILNNKDIQAEAEAVLRELRIMHCAEALEEAREAISAGAPLPAHGGAAAPRLVEAIKEHEVRLVRSGRVWTDGTAYDLAYLLTARGQAWRFIQKNIVCSKVPGEAGLCRKNKGEPDTSNCKLECGNRLVLSLAHRDAGEIVKRYMDVAQQACDEGLFDLLHYSMERLMEELNNFPDIREKYMADAQLQSLINIYQDLSNQ